MVLGVICGHTKPGEIVCVVGNQEVLGLWDPQHALPLSTNAEIFPRWHLAANVPLPARVDVEFKLLIQPADRRGISRWEKFCGNRRIALEPGQVLHVDAAWGDRKLACSSVPKGHAQHACSILAEELASRELPRRNFSQSLLCIDPSPELGEDRKAELEAPEAKGMDLSHVTSFCALSSMADAKDKIAFRQGQQERHKYEPSNLDIPVVIVTSEIAPWSKTGGLGLVAASYSYEFAQNGHRTMVVAPRYAHYESLKYVGATKVRVDACDEQIRFFHINKDFGGGRNCDYVFVDHPCIEREGGLYNGEDGKEYDDNIKRFTLLSLAALEAPLILKLGGCTFGDEILFIANDWQSGLVPVYMCYKYRAHGRYTNARVIYTVHNLGYQGVYHIIDACKFFGLGYSAYKDLQFGSCINCSKAALICSDRVVTVSPNYAHEIQTIEGGFGLHEEVRSKAYCMRLVGILNGIDDNWNPSTDKLIAVNYSLHDFEHGKRNNKAALQRQLGLDQEENAVVFGFVGRLTWQKGVDILGEAISWLMEDYSDSMTGRVQLIMMGQGDRSHAATLHWAESTYSGRVRGYVGYETKLEHQMMAGCDMLIMPSRYEPCGLPQMYAQSYGTLPIATRTGGLVDSVTDVSQGVDSATGFYIPRLDVGSLMDTLATSLDMFFQMPGQFRTMQQRAMSMDFYWPRAIDQYEQNIDWTLSDPPTTR